MEYVRQPPLPRIMDLLLLWALPSFLTSLHSVFHKRSGLLVSFDCFDNCCRERGERERERERDGDGVVVVACSSRVRKHTCSSNALVHVTQCVFCCGRKKKRSRTSTKTTMTAAEAMKLVRIWTPMD